MMAAIRTCLSGLLEEGDLFLEQIKALVLDSYQAEARQRIHGIEHGGSLANEASSGIDNAHEIALCYDLGGSGP